MTVRKKKNLKNAFRNKYLKNIVIFLGGLYKSCNLTYLITRKIKFWFGLTLNISSLDTKHSYFYYIIIMIFLFKLYFDNNVYIISFLVKLQSLKRQVVLIVCMNSYYALFWWHFHNCTLLCSGASVQFIGPSIVYEPV